MSPRLRFGARVWNTTGAGSPETSDWIIENLPTSGTTPTSLLKFGYSANGGSYGYPYTFSNLGAFTATLFNGLSIIGGASSVLDIAASKTVNIDNNFNLNGGDVTVVGNGTGNTISFPTGVDTLVGQASIDTLTGLKTLQHNNIVVTSHDGLVFTNDTAATSIVPVQMSPRTRYSARVWNTTGAGSPETSDWIIENLPTSGTTPSSLLKFGYSANGGSYGYPYTFSNAGAFTATLVNGLSIIGGASSVLDIAASKTVNIDNNFNLNGGDVTVVGNGTGNTISFPTGVDTLVGQASVDTLTGLKTLQHNNIVVTSHDGLVFTNDTASTSGVPVQMSPRRRLRANVWNTTATAANNTFDFIDELFPTSGTTPTAVYRLGFSRAGGSYAYPYLFGDTGDISFPLTAGVKLGISATEKIGL